MRLDYPQLASSGSWALLGHPSHCGMSSVEGIGTGATLASSASAGARADVTRLRKCTESDASSQGLQHESLHLEGKTWCYR